MLGFTNERFTFRRRLSDYNLGCTLEQSAAHLKKKTGRHVSPSTIASWLDEYHQHCTYRASAPATRRIRRLPSTLQWLHRPHARIPSICAGRDQQRLNSNHATQILFVKRPTQPQPSGGLPPTNHLMERRARRAVSCPSRNANAQSTCRCVR
jgi:hypothetical protein